jgi:hypothetical protein
MCIIKVGLKLFKYVVIFRFYLGGFVVEVCFLFFYMFLGMV